MAASVKNVIVGAAEVYVSANASNAARPATHLKASQSSYGTAPSTSGSSDGTDIYGTSSGIDFANAKASLAFKN